MAGAGHDRVLDQGMGQSRLGRARARPEGNSSQRGRRVTRENLQRHEVGRRPVRTRLGVV